MTALLVSTWVHIRRGHRHSCQRLSRSAVHFPSRGRALWIGGRRWPLANLQREVSFYFLYIAEYASSKRYFLFFVVIVWMLHIGRARHPGPGPQSFTPGQLSIEFVNVGGWLTSGDLALDSCAQFLANAEHRLIPSRARSVCHQLRRAGHSSIWAPACQDKIAGGHAGVGVISLGGASLSLPSFVTPQFFRSFSGLVVS